MPDPGVQQQLHHLYSHHHGWLKAWLRKKLSCQHTAADLAQDTFVRLIVSDKTPLPGQSRAYLTQIAKGLVIDLYRRQRLEQAYHEWLLQLPPIDIPSPEQQAIALQSLIQLDKVFDQLPARVRETFILSRFDQRTYSEIAAQLGISVAAVRKYMLKATQACMEQL
ncbi:RNA polymerase sigma-70 factor, ECF subfamily [Methylophilus rhizosphaerae]|uniref:RNA polymerase sigma-70 factor, ECF subfamily n=1 Tax=Methylophilus rhizosphaerae TaxID=492660 RepID=A0A1G9BQH1_9PROT|nr:sigma-70 family RNA polymerase sigma factor [Methylophilus rhizosphaerae]SDK41404.1 RNA polymerase sigma-70 factor, ECF subfamily [Methylophilus rhizosphaerae]